MTRYGLVLLACLLAAGCNKEEATKAEAPAAKQPEPKGKKDEVVISPEQQAAAMVRTEPARTSQQPDLLRVQGRIAMADDRTYRVGVRTVGMVVSVNANLGDFVKKGQVLARYHADEVRDSRAQYRAAQAELERTKTVAAQAQRNHARAQKLLELKAGSQQQVETTLQEAATAKLAIRKAEIEVGRLRDVLEHELHVPAEPPAGTSESDADEVPILAPESGYVIARNVTPGKTVELSTDTFIIGDISKVWMLASVRQEDLGKLRTAQSATVILPGQPEVQFHGKITNLGQQFNPETRVMEVRIELGNPNGRLRPEMLTTAEIPVGGVKPGVVVPSEAVQQVNGQDVLFVKTAADRFSVRAVRTGPTIDGRTPILEGIKTGEEVAVHGTFILKSQLLKSTLESE